MSLRPGIGALAVGDIWAAYSRFIGDNDVPQTLSIGGRPKPLGRYLRRKLRELAPNPALLKEKAMETFSLEMRALQLSIREKKPETTYAPYQKVLLDEFAQKVCNLESRYKLYKSKGSL